MTSVFYYVFIYRIDRYCIIEFSINTAIIDPLSPLIQAKVYRDHTFMKSK